VRTGSALDEGIGRWELGQDRWEHPFWGIVRLGSGDPRGGLTRIENSLPLLTPGSVLTGWAAAFVQGASILDGIDRFGRLLPIVIATPEGGQLRPRAGILPTRRAIHRNEIVDFDGVPVATLARAAYDMALDAPNVCEALVAIDMCTSTVLRQSRTTLANIQDVIDRHKKTRGIVRARRALELASSRSASPWESRTRHAAEVGAGIQGLLVNVPIFDDDERLAGIADLFEPKSGLVVESDGAGHREEVAHAKDNIREEKFERLGLVVSRVGAIDHRNLPELSSRLAAARLHATLLNRERIWTLDKPDWWWRWEPGRRWD